MKALISLIFGLVLSFSLATPVQAQRLSPSPQPLLMTTEASLSAEAIEASRSALEQAQLQAAQEANITQPETPQNRDQIIDRFQSRPATTFDGLNLFAYLVQYAVAIGVPANTIVLILLVPFLATAIAFIRVILGFPTMEMLVPIILSITFIASGMTVGLILLLAILIGSLLSRLLLKDIKIMQLPKMAMSLLFVSLFVFLALILLAAYGILAVRQISIFPILILTLLSDRIVALQIGRKLGETLTITGLTIVISFIGYLFLTSPTIQNFILLYPEAILILIPINILIGRYFGLRLTEYVRFAKLKN